MDFGRTPNAILVIVPSNLPWNDSFAEGSPSNMVIYVDFLIFMHHLLNNEYLLILGASFLQEKNKSCILSSTTNLIQTEEAVYQSTLFSKFPTNILECCKNGNIINNRDRRSIIDIIATYMIHDLKKTDRKTAGEISNALCNMYPKSFKAGLENIGKTIAADVFKQSIYDAVNYRKMSRKKLRNETDSDESESEISNKRKNKFEQDEYGLVEYHPLLPPAETQQSQEAKRLS